MTMMVHFVFRRAGIRREFRSFAAFTQEEALRTGRDRRYVVRRKCPKTRASREQNKIIGQQSKRRTIVKVPFMYDQRPLIIVPAFALFPAIENRSTMMVWLTVVRRLVASHTHSYPPPEAVTAPLDRCLRHPTRSDL
ncbi:unnamed protein product [Ectocarpus sp. 12 AP-2014]